MRKSLLHILSQGAIMDSSNIDWAFREEFSVDSTAPISDRSAQPGPGELYFYDSLGTIAVIDDGDYQMLTYTALGDPAFWCEKDGGGAFTRAAGLGWFFQIKTEGRLFTAFDTNKSGFGDILGLEWRTGGLYPLDAQARSVVNKTYTVGEYYKAAVIVKSDKGGYIFIKGQTEFPEWRLLWVNYESSINTSYLSFSPYTDSSYYCSYMRVDDNLPTPFDTDYGYATERLSGSRTPGDIFTHEADTLIRFTATTLPSSDQIELRFRIQDSSNYWQVTIDSAGNVDLDEVVSGTPTQRGTWLGAISGDVFTIIIDDEHIEIVEGGSARRIDYTSAANFKTSTSGKLETEGTGGSVSDIEVYPIYPSGLAKTVLDSRSFG